MVIFYGKFCKQVYSFFSPIICHCILWDNILSILFTTFKISMSLDANGKMEKTNLYLVMIDLEPACSQMGKIPQEILLKLVCHEPHQNYPSLINETIKSFYPFIYVSVKLLIAFISDS